MANAAEQMARNMNFRSFAKAKDLQSRILFTLGILLLYRLGTFIPLPGLDPSQYAQYFESQSGGLLGNMNMFAGGAVERMGVFALNVMPYITASIIIQMLTATSPTLEKLKKEGESGRKQINQYTRYLTLGFALVQSFAIAGGLAGFRIDGISSWFFILTGVVTLTGGTMLLMWMGEQITARGIGNGISLIIFAGIIAEMPKAIFNLISQARTTSVNVAFVVAIAAMVIALVVFIVFMERSQRRLLIQYPKRQQAHGVAQGQKSFLPLKINTSGVIPPIFASAILMLPLTAVGFLGGNPADAEATGAMSGVLGWLATNFAPGSWTYIVSYGAMVIFFAFFYTSIMFNPEETADNLRKYGGFIPGIRPGSNTAAYIDYVLTRLTTIGALYLMFVCILPELLRRYFPEIPFYIGGTSLLIVVSVTMDTVTQIQSHLIAHQYEGMIKKSKLGGRKR
ncbi:MULTISPECIES: preprotein translocase subunit SecY [Hyphomonas]|jgi:preprotein translocase subunit SecY|uniref:Protein translocase subunit SecY n=4 Tax=Hyphomonas atlantica TaxID=1280948 RepID=A0A059E0D4_9PROT|nr:preprotein translocase subunit SecY [Hyphomonas atlantica]MAM08538.1 preprotein translocase subunit SecY [Hyphomonas sp.]HBH43590.1 preprotein translocase subunit SecY [Hyphomonas atlantica]|tara:strand:+ start:6248 stop:7606 length:1359 start_codon:yes stop_codon:yes gene_type:complete